MRWLLYHILLWRRRHRRDRRFMLLLAFFVGIGAALAGMVLKFIIEEIEFFITQGYTVTHANWLNLVYPVIGIMLTSLFVRYVVRDDISHGVTRILFAIARKQSLIKAHNCWSSVVASAITIGFGGSVGAEAPIVLTGSAVGSNLGRFFRLSGKQMMVLVGCGAAAAIAGIFKAPIAGLVFVLEVLMIDLSMTSLLPLLVSCVTAAGVVFVFSGTETIFRFELKDAFTVSRTPAYILLGVICGLLALYFTRMMNWMESQVFRRLRSRRLRFLVGGSVLSVLIFLFPALYGEGYDLIELLLNGEGMNDWEQALNGSFFYGHGEFLLLYLLLVVLTKVFASTATNGGGGCGGIFAPSLFLGCIAGFIFAVVWNRYDPFGLHIPERNFAMLGMCGMMSGVMHAPLTGIFLIAELTGGYGLFMPLMIVSMGAYITIKTFEPHSIYAMRLARRGELVTHNTDKAILTLMSMDSVIQHYDEVLRPDDTLGEIARQVANSKNHVFPVVNGAGRLMGEVYLDDIRHLVFRPELFNEFRASQLMTKSPTRLNIEDRMDTVAKVFDQTHAWILPVVDSEGLFQGTIRKSALLAVYRQMLADSSDE